MKIKTKNLLSKNYKYRIRGKITDLEKINKKTLKENSITDIINKFNTDKIINPLNIDNEINIIFTSFSKINEFFTNIKIFFKKINNNEYEKELAQFDVKNKTITIDQHFFKEGFNKNNTDNVLNILLKDGINENDIFNLVVLHELGHAVFYSSHNLIKTDLPEGKYRFMKSFMDLNYDYFTYNADQAIISKMMLSIMEGYADLYSVIALEHIYNDNTYTDKILQSLINARKTNKKENYNTYYSLTKYQEDKDKLNFNGFEQLHTYMIKTTIETAFDLLINSLNNPHGLSHEETNQLEEFLGFLKMKYKNNDILKNCETPNSVLNTLNNHYKLNLNLSNIYFNNNDDNFINGQEKYQNLNKTNRLFKKIKFNK